jgi:hypothetical protein
VIEVSDIFRPQKIWRGFGKEKMKDSEVERGAARAIDRFSLPFDPGELSRNEGTPAPSVRSSSGGGRFPLPERYLMASLRDVSAAKSLICKGT